FSSRRRHTRSTRDWSSDVCSSDLLSTQPCYPHLYELSKNGVNRPRRGALRVRPVDREAAQRRRRAEVQTVQTDRRGPLLHGGTQIGRASCRERERRSGGAGHGIKK